jgi:hypothetical protein
MATKRKKKLTGTVNKIIEPARPTEPEKAEISVHEAEELYRELRIENTLTTEKGEKEKLKKGAKVDLTVEADSNATIKKPA